ncbi:MAG: thioesterase family protein [Alcanivoracaceae bacterium]|jgi:acyl-CoA thioester hydrolase|nr:thioesterase family protein [Alcanivoracaceae bacterium]
MFELRVRPRFYETDAFGHINNTTVSGWFETAREPLFEMFAPTLDPAALNLILARTAIDFIAQLHYGADVVIRTAIERIGNSSFVVVHEAWQKDMLAARGKAVQVCFDHQTQKSRPLSDSQRQQLQAHLIEQDNTAR